MIDAYRYLAAVLVLSASCGADSARPSSAEPVLRIELQVTGGIAGVDYALELDARAELARGLRCVSFCDFEAGQVLARLTDAQTAELLGAVEEAGIRELGDRDFGTQCCDQFQYVITLEDQNGSVTVQGSQALLPPEVEDVASLLSGLQRGVAPLVVALGTEPASWPSDPLTVVDASIDGGGLVVEVTYPGGCADHDVDAVAFNGWLESFPTQVGVFLAHDAHQDPCDALVTETRRFDLTTLEWDHRDSYGDTGRLFVIRLWIEHPTRAGPDPPLRLLEHRY